STALTVFMGVYLLIRRGYFFDAPSTADMLYVPNKAIVGAGTILLAFTFLIGPVVRYFDRFDKWLGYRKEIGIVGALLALSHGTISYFYLPQSNPNEYIDFTSFEFGAGILGALLLFFLFIISFKKAIEFIGASRWWFLQRWGLRLVIAFTLVHIYALKWNGWARWLTQGAIPSKELMAPWLPGASLLATLFITWVVVVRLYETIFIFRNFGLTTKEITMDEPLKIQGRRFFIGSFWILVVFYILVITRWMW
ncbi:MAG: ferric reductase-like transmembrane domain-containing protein, partial [bacterium]|nr:ferric reductase-like transmembrane domain-containing protein [bacterium]